MKKLLSLASLSLVLFAVSCKSNDDFETNNQEKEITLSTADLSNRIVFDNIGVVGIKEAPDEDPEATETSASNAKTAVVNDIPANNIPLLKVAEVSAPTYEGQTLRATHVVIEGDYAYVSFNVEGDNYLGAVDVINISDPANPVMELEAILPNTDISSLAYYNNALYLAGATNSTVVNETNPAVLVKVELENGIPTENISLIDMPSFVATDVIANQNGIYGVSGDNGVLAQYNQNSTELEQEISIGDLRAIGNYDSKIVVLSGTDGVYVYDEDNLSETLKINTSSDIAASKRTIDFYDDNVLVSEGKNGMVAYNLNNGNKTTTIDLPEVTDINIDLNEVVTNAVTVEDDHIFVANGAAGLAVHNISNNLLDLTTIGTLEIDGSTNYVKSANGYIFVASGDGGLKIIKSLANESDDETEDDSSIVCTGDEFTTYTGNSWLNVNSNQTKYYTGATSLQGLNVNADLTYCGTLAVSQSINVNGNGNFYMSGSLSQGSTGNGNSFNINNNFYLEGSLVVYGNMIMNGNALFEVLGSGSSITIYGNLTLNGNAELSVLNSNTTITVYGNVIKNGNNTTVSEDFIDTENKF